MTLAETHIDRGGVASPDFLTIPGLDQPLRTTLFNVALTNWTYNSNLGMLEALLQDPFGNHERLKQVRKAGLVMRSAYLLFTDASMPASQHRIVKAIGLQNDWMKLRGEPQGDAIIEAVRLFTPQELKPTLVDDIMYQKRVSTAANNIVSVASSPNPDPDTFHKMRIELRHFLNIFRMLELLPGTQPTTILERIDTMNDLLGQMHDDALHIVNGTVVYHAPSIPISPRISQEVIGLVREIAPQQSR